MTDSKDQTDKDINSLGEGSSTANMHMAMKDNLVSLNRGGSDMKYLGERSGKGGSRNQDLDR